MPNTVMILFIYYACMIMVSTKGKHGHAHPEVKLIQCLNPRNFRLNFLNEIVQRVAIATWYIYYV